MGSEKQQLSDDGISVSLTPSPLDITSTMATVRNPEAGAIVLFAGNSSQESRVPYLRRETKLNQALLATILPANP